MRRGSDQRRDRKGGGLGKKLTDWVAWTDQYATRCPDCREMYGRRQPPQDPPCHRCRVELSAENDLDAKVYMMTRRQVVTVGMNGQIVDISIPAVKIAMELYGVKDQAACLVRVRKLFHHFLKAEVDDAG